ncbi:MAG: hypothetical protein R2911_24445 [Caldilineaceae bacterium]
MATVQTLTRRFEQVFEPQQAVVLAESITEAYNDLVKTSDFNELKAIVKSLAEAQSRTEMRMEELAEAQQRTEMRVDELAQAQQRTEIHVGELTQAQQRLDVRMEELAQAQQRTEVRMEELAHVVADMGRNLGGLSKSMAYSLENEAYRSLPAFLREHYGITLSERIIRTQISEEEVNFFALGERNGEPICLVGESKLQLDERRRNFREAETILTQIERKVEAVQPLYPDRAIVRLLVTHYARPAVVDFMEKNDVLVVQTFEW